MSTLTFLPYIGEHFTKEYIIPNYIGESLSSLIPGILAMAQGLQTSDEHCKSSASLTTNLTANLTAITTPPLVVNLHRPNFSVSVYFFLMFVLLLFSILAFTMLNFSKSAVAHRKAPKITRISFAAVDNENENGDDNDDEDEGIDSMSIDQIMPHTLNHHVEVVNDPKQRRFEVRVLLILIFFVTFMYYGFLPGLLSYSTIPYSPKFFNLSMNLSKNNSLSLSSTLFSF